MSFFDFLFPRRCVSCGKLGRYFCSTCTSIIQIIKVEEMVCPVCGRPSVSGMTHNYCKKKYALDGLISFFRYQGPIREALKKIKYRFVSDLAKELISFLPSSHLQLVRLLVSNASPVILIPIPLHPTRLRFRGFNQAELLGKLFAEKLNIFLRTDILKRVKNTPPQVELKERKKRLKNMEGVFAVDSSIKLESSFSVILFDDVFTTGATMQAGASILKKAGMKKIWGVTLAHG